MSGPARAARHRSAVSNGAVGSDVRALRFRFKFWATPLLRTCRSFRPCFLRSHQIAHLDTPRKSHEFGPDVRTRWPVMSPWSGLGGGRRAGRIALRIHCTCAGGARSPPAHSHGGRIVFANELRLPAARRRSTRGGGRHLFRPRCLEHAYPEGANCRLLDGSPGLLAHVHAQELAVAHTCATRCRANV